MSQPQPQPLPSWNFLDLRSVFSAPQELEVLVDHFLVRPSLNVLYGAPGTFKSLILAHLALHVASGRPWLPDGRHRAFDTVQGPVMWLDLDNGLWRTKNRFAALARELDITPDADFHLLSMPNPPLHVSDSETLVMLRDALVEKDISLCIIDNLGFVAGGWDENKSHMVTVMGNFRTLAENTNTAFVLIHHQRKGVAGGARQGDSLRGHSSIEASLDLAVRVIREEKEMCCRLESTKSRDVPFQEVAMEFYYTPAADGFSLETAGFHRKHLETGDDRRQRIIDAIIATVETHQEIAKTRLAAEVKSNYPDMPGINVVRGEIDTLCEANQLVGVRKQRAFMIRLPRAAPAPSENHTPSIPYVN